MIVLCCGEGLSGEATVWHFGSESDLAYTASCSGCKLEFSGLGHCVFRAMVTLAALFATSKAGTQ